tara:strand:+ start:322 stop:675 length:354 start_codon:yes stop_codon:yes gene_type:complete
MIFILRFRLPLPTLLVFNIIKTKKDCKKSFDLINFKTLFFKKLIMKKIFKVEIIKENALSTLFFGSSKLPINKMEACLNNYGKKGWDVAFQVIEQHRLLLFWSREAVVITFSKEIEG